jgi:hypothetical protein
MSRMLRARASSTGVPAAIAAAFARGEPKCTRLPRVVAAPRTQRCAGGVAPGAAALGALGGTDGGGGIAARKRASCSSVRGKFGFACGSVAAGARSWVLGTAGGTARAAAGLGAVLGASSSRRDVRFGALLAAAAGASPAGSSFGAVTSVRGVSSVGAVSAVGGVSPVAAPTPRRARATILGANAEARWEVPVLLFFWFFGGGTRMHSGEPGEVSVCTRSRHRDMETEKVVRVVKH